MFLVDQVYQGCITCHTCRQYDSITAYCYMTIDKWENLSIAVGGHDRLLWNVSIDRCCRRQRMTLWKLGSIVCCRDNGLGIPCIDRYCPPRYIVKRFHRWPLPAAMDCASCLSTYTVHRNRLWTAAVSIDGHCRSQYTVEAIHQCRIHCGLWEDGLTKYLHRLCSTSVCLPSPYCLVGFDLLFLRILQKSAVGTNGYRYTHFPDISIQLL